MPVALTIPAADLGVTGGTNCSGRGYGEKVSLAVAGAPGMILRFEAMRRSPIPPEPVQMG